MNIYRGCSHGCIYCDSRSRCYQMNHAFEDIEVKKDAPRILEAQLKSRRKKCMVSTGAMTDPYIPLEMELQYTRRCIEAVERNGFGLVVLTKSDRILRDLDLLKKINEKTKCVVQMTLTTYDETLCKILEPDVCTTPERLRVLRILRDNGIPTVVWICPILPFINDTPENIEGLSDCCAEAGVKGILSFGMGMTLREGSREYFYAALDRQFPGLREKYRQVYGQAYQLPSPHSAHLAALLREKCRSYGMMYGQKRIFEYLNTFEEKSAFEQLELF